MSIKDQYITDRIVAAAPIAAACIRQGLTVKESADVAVFLVMKMEQAFANEFHKVNKF